MKSCALLTCDDLGDHVLDEDRLEKALTDAGWSFQWIPWRTQGVSWGDYDCALVRTTWDYTENPNAFFQQLRQIEDSPCRLFNPIDLLQWNRDKKYLQELKAKGVSVIPTHWEEEFDPSTLPDSVATWPNEKIVVKPQVGAGSVNTFLFSKEEWVEKHNELSALAGQQVMIQPFMEKVVTEGEHSAHYFAGEHSHTILKTPKAQDFRSQEEYGSHVRKIEPSSPQLEFCEKVLDQLQSDWLYARVDFINDGEGKPHLIELEMIEPSLYFRCDDQAAVRLVQAMGKKMNQ